MKNRFASRGLLVAAVVATMLIRLRTAASLRTVDEFLKTVQPILGHSDLETTLNIYMHAIPDSQRRAVERVAGVLFPDVPNSSAASNEAVRVN